MEIAKGKLSIGALDFSHREVTLQSAVCKFRRGNRSYPAVVVAGIRLLLHATDSEDTLLIRNPSLSSAPKRPAALM